MSNQGRVVWHDLMSTDPSASEAFFTQLFGWEVREVDMGPGGKYRMLSSGGTDIGGIVPFDKAHGAPSHWIAYIAVDDVDACCERANAHGGKACVPPMDIPNVGRFAVVEDAKGAIISPFATAGAYSPEPEGSEPAGQFIWEELLTTDPAQAKTFYSEVFGWSAREEDMGVGMYTVFSSAGKDRAGCMAMPPGVEAPPHWLSYVRVDDVHASAAKVKQFGGQVYKDPTELPGIGEFAVCADPSGAAFAFYKPVAKS